MRSGRDGTAPTNYDRIVPRLSETAFTFIAPLGFPPIGSRIC